MGRSDRLETGLTLSLPWLVVLVFVLLQALAQCPRPAFHSADRLLIVAAPAGQAAVYSADGRRQSTAPLTRPALFDLARSDAQWLTILGDGRVRASAVRFDANAIQAALERHGRQPPEQDLDWEVAYPDPQASGIRQVMVTVHPYRLLPPATWDTYLWEVTGRPRCVLARRDDPAPLTIARDDQDRLVLTNLALARRNRVLAWTGTEYAAVPAGPVVPYALNLLGRAFVMDPWWGSLLALLPLIGLGLAGSCAVGRLNAAARRGPTWLAETAGLLVGLALLAAALTALAWLRLNPLLDRFTALLAPALVGAAVVIALRGTAWAAERGLPGDSSASAAP